jgi:hypothetical protein
MTKKEKQNKLAVIARTIKGFPKIVKQNEMRGKSHRSLMKAFAPMAKDLAKRVKRAKESA